MNGRQRMSAFPAHREASLMQYPVHDIRRYCDVTGRRVSHGAKQYLDQLPATTPTDGQPNALDARSETTETARAVILVMAERGQSQWPSGRRCHFLPLTRIAYR
jgi:hypothetical protein